MRNLKLKNYCGGLQFSSMQLWKFIWAWWAHRSRSASSSSVLHFRMSSWCLFSHRVLILSIHLSNSIYFAVGVGSASTTAAAVQALSVVLANMAAASLLFFLVWKIRTVSFLWNKGLYLQKIRIVWVALLAERRSDPRMVLEFEVGWFCFQQWCRRSRSRRRKKKASFVSQWTCCSLLQRDFITFLKQP